MLEDRIRPDFRKAVVSSVVALAALIVGHLLGNIHSHNLHTRLIAIGCAVGVLVFGVLATRSAAGEVERIAGARAGATAATPLRVVCLLVGYVIVVLAALDLLDTPIGHLLVGGAVTGVILGIAAQQSLANVFAGLVLLLSRPYVPGERILIRSGALGGPLEGMVTRVGLAYTTLLGSDGIIVNIPNAGLLAAAVGPAPPPEPDAEEKEGEVA
jgi:small-conductance mechanosensitive channel